MSQEHRRPHQANVYVLLHNYKRVCQFSAQHAAWLSATCSGCGVLSTCSGRAPKVPSMNSSLWTGTPAVKWVNLLPFLCSDGKQGAAASSTHLVWDVLSTSLLSFEPCSSQVWCHSVPCNCSLAHTHAICSLLTPNTKNNPETETTSVNNDIKAKTSSRKKKPHNFPLVENKRKGQCSMAGSQCSPLGLQECLQVLLPRA